MIGPRAVAAVWLAATFAIPLLGQNHVYRLACNAGEAVDVLHDLRAVSAIKFGPGDSLQIQRGSVCEGTLLLQGSGTAAQPVRVGAFGSGATPVLRAEKGAEQALELRDGSHWEIADLEIEGGTKRGLFITATSGVAEDIKLLDLYVHDVYGTLRKKEEGLVIVAPAAGAALRHVRLDGIVAARTSLWSGIFIAGSEGETPSRDVVVENSIAHDVQGDGIVLFALQDGTIQNSSAWHIGMQHSYSIGTPNGIWTWHCTRCTVTDSEAFLIDSPGVDGGSFDIDFGNTENRVLHNFGHHTQGYCVSVFGAFGPTRNSEVAYNTCLHNGESPRLAERQGAMLLMTWSNGSIENVTIHDNFIDWRPAGNTPAFQAGEDLHAKGVNILRNRVRTQVSPLIAPALQSLLGSQDSPYHLERQAPVVGGKGTTAPATLSLTLTASISEGELRGLLARLATLASQFGETQLRTSLRVPMCSPARLRAMVNDFAKHDRELHVEATPCPAPDSCIWSFRGTTAWHLPLNADRTLLWQKISASIGEPDFSRLSFVQVPAHD